MGSKTHDTTVFLLNHFSCYTDRRGAHFSLTYKQSRGEEGGQTCQIHSEQEVEQLQQTHQAAAAVAAARLQADEVTGTWGRT